MQVGIAKKKSNEYCCSVKHSTLWDSPIGTLSPRTAQTLTGTDANDLNDLFAEHCELKSPYFPQQTSHIDNWSTSEQQCHIVIGTKMARNSGTIAARLEHSPFGRSTGAGLGRVKHRWKLSVVGAVRLYDVHSAASSV